MIEDFKFNPKLDAPRKHRRRLLAAAFVVLVAVGGVVRFVDFDGFQATAPALQPATATLVLPTAPAARSAPLALPAAPAARSAPLALPAAPAARFAPLPLPAAPAVRSAPLALPALPAAPSVALAPPARSGATAAARDAAQVTPAPSLLSTAPVRAEVAPVPEQPAALDEQALARALRAVPAPLAAPPEHKPTAEMRTVSAAVVEEPVWSEHKIRKGDSLAAIFKKQDLSPSLLHRIVNSSKTAKRLAHIRPGQKLRFLREANGTLRRLELIRDPVNSLEIQINADEISAEEISRAVESRLANASGLIESSLFLDGQKAGLTDGQIMELAGIFGWDIDFALEIRAGDQFRVLFEERYLDGRKFGNGPILAAEFVNRGKLYQAVHYEDDKGDVGYYDAEGRNKRRAFIRTPIKFARVSSKFSRKRWHPVLKRWRSHKGVDYAGPRGTPVKSTGAGKVIFRGRKGGYGRTIIVQHGGKYQTLYAHMSKYAGKARKGSRVKQGQVIGYVGSSGLATGPHLHYEFRVNGVHRNPLTVKFPKAQALPKAQLTAFRAQTAPLLTQLASIESNTLVARADN